MRTCIEKTIDKRQIDRDEDQDRLHCEHVEWAIDGTMDNAFERPILLLMFCEHFSLGGIGFSDFLSLVTHDN